VPDAFVDMVRQHARARGPAYAITGDLSASGQALRSAVGLLDARHCDAVVVFAASGAVGPRRDFWSARGQLGSGASIPLSSARDGLRPGEGAAVLVLERQGNAEVELRAVEVASDPAEALRRSLARSELVPTQLSWVACGADGRVDSDRRLAEAIRSELGSSLPVTSAVALRGSLGPAQDLAAVVDVVRSVGVGRVGPLGPAGAVEPRFGLQPVVEPRELETDHAITLHAGAEDDFTAVVLTAREP
jgi:3-oxoacyl-(acyl-carrier-protein) synthase